MASTLSGENSGSFVDELYPCGAYNTIKITNTAAPLPLNHSPGDSLLTET